MSPKSRGWACTDPQTWRLDLRIKIKLRAISNNTNFQQIDSFGLSGFDTFLSKPGLEWLSATSICSLEKSPETKNGGVVHSKSDWLKNRTNIFYIENVQKGVAGSGPNTECLLNRTFGCKFAAEGSVSKQKQRCVTKNKLSWAAISSQRSLHCAPIFRLLLKVAVNGTRQCDFHNFWGASCSNC